MSTPAWMLKVKKSSLPNSLEEFQQDENIRNKKKEKKVATYNFSDDSDDDENLFCLGRRELSHLKTMTDERSFENDASVVASTSLVTSLQLSSMNMTNAFIPILESTRLCDKDPPEFCQSVCEGAEQNVKSEEENTANSKESTRMSRVNRNKYTMKNKCADNDKTPLPCKSRIRKSRQGNVSDITSEFTFPLDITKKDGRSSCKKFQLYEGETNLTPVCADKSNSKLCTKSINFLYHGKLPATAEKVKKSTEQYINSHNVKDCTRYDSDKGTSLLVEVQDNSMQTSFTQELNTSPQVSVSEEKGFRYRSCNDEWKSDASNGKEHYSMIQDSDDQITVHSMKANKDDKVGGKLSPSLDSESNYLVLRLNFTPNEAGSHTSASSARENSQLKKVSSLPEIFVNSSNSELCEVQDISMQTSILLSGSPVESYTSEDANSPNVTNSSFYEVQDISVQTSQLSQLNYSNSLTARASQNCSPGSIFPSVDQVNDAPKQLDCEEGKNDKISDDEALQQGSDESLVNIISSSPKEISLYKTANVQKSPSDSLSTTGVCQDIATSQTSFYYTTLEQLCGENSCPQNVIASSHPITPYSKDMVTGNFCDDSADIIEESLILACDSDDGMSRDECGTNSGCNQFNAKNVTSITSAGGKVLGLVEECIADSDISHMSNQGEFSYAEAMSKLYHENNDPLEKESEANDSQWTDNMKYSKQIIIHNLGAETHNSTTRTNVASQETATIEVSSLEGDVSNLLDDQTESDESIYEMNNSIRCEEAEGNFEDMSSADGIVASIESLSLSKPLKQKINFDSSDDDDDDEFENFLKKMKSQTQKTCQEENLLPLNDFIVNDNEADESCGFSLSEDEDDELFYLKVNNDLDSERALRVRAENEEYHCYSDDSIKENVLDDKLDDFIMDDSSQIQNHKLELSSDDDLLVNIESDKMKTHSKKKTAVSDRISNIKSEEGTGDEPFGEHKANTSKAFKTPKRTNLWERPFETPAVVSKREDSFKTPSVVKVKKLPAQTAPHPSRLSTFGLDDTFYFLKSLSDAYPDHKRHSCALRHIKKFKETKGELTKKLFKIFNTKIFELKLPEDLNIEWNARYTKTAGTFSCRGTMENTVFKITLSDKVCDSPERVRDTLAHELCHAAVRIVSGVQESHGRIWKSWARKVNNAFPFMPVIARCHDYIISAKYTYQCVSCKYRISRHSKSLDTDKKICGHCRGRFEVFLTRDLQMSGSDGQHPTPHTPRTPNRFAVYVKENYSEVKKSNSGAKHADVMKILSKEFAEKNKI